MELFDGKTGHQKTVDLSGQGKRTHSDSLQNEPKQAEAVTLGMSKELVPVMLGLNGPVLIGYSESQSFWKPVLFLSSV